MFNSAQAFEGEGTLEYAETDLLEVIRLNPNNVPARKLIKQVRVKMRAMQAKEDFDKLVIAGKEKVKGTVGRVCYQSVRIVDGIL
jgi:hypothetical protein